jgi:hypothetical protein
LSDFEDCFETYDFKWIKRRLVSRESALLRAGLIEYVYDGGFEEREAYKLTDMAKTSSPTYRFIAERKFHQSTRTLKR